MFNKKYSKLEEIHALRSTIELNNEAIDYITNKISNIGDMRVLCPDDEELEYEYKTCKYIKFSLNYLNDCYEDRLKVLGCKVNNSLEALND